MKVSEQTNRLPLTCPGEMPVSDVARAMVEKACMHVVVVDPAGAPVGVVTAGDLIAKHARLHFPTYFSLLGFSFPVENRREDREIEKALAATAADLMTTAVVTVSGDVDVDDAATLMLDHEVSCLPVVENGILAGTIDESDIVRLLVVEESQ